LAKFQRENHDGDSRQSEPEKALVTKAGEAGSGKDDLLRLRNENRQLREEKQQLGKELEAAKKTANAPNPQQQQELAKAMAELQQFRTQTAMAQQSSQAMACVNILRQIDAAKQQWALENNRAAGSVVGPQDVAPYFPNQTFPTCPAGGAYTMSPIGQAPLCSIPGHVLRK
jgi:hypothetical protein